MNDRPALKQQIVKINTASRAFTLLEVVIVLAVTAVVFGLLLRPIISSLSLTQEAQSLAAAQDSGRKAIESLSRELGHADYVFSGLSHPFTLLGGNPLATSSSSTDTYTDFLDIEVPANPTALASGKSYTVAHIYGAKIDFALAQPKQTNVTFIDPTSHQPVTLQNSASGAVTEQTAPAVLPLAANTTLVRYFIGLQRPIVNGAQGHYSNANIGLPIKGQSNNTYVLYRAQVSVYQPNSTNVDTRYFATVAESQGETTGPDLNSPELDDPDFFRFVNAGDIDWLDPTHATYTGSLAEQNTAYTTPLSTSEVDAHNIRVSNWMQIATPVVSAPNIDLLDIPHNSDGTISYDVNGIACSGTYAQDVVVGATKNLDLPTAILPSQAEWPIANVTVSFTPSVYPTESPSPASSENLTENVGNTSGETTGIPFVPSAYQGAHGSWSPNYSLALYPADYNRNDFGKQSGSYFTTSQTFVPASTTINGTTYTDVPGDMIEYRNDANSSATVVTPVYNITQGFPESGASAGTGIFYNYYVPFTVNADKGYLNFAIPAVAPRTDLQSAPAFVPWPQTTGEYSDANPSNPYFIFSGNAPPPIFLAITKTAAATYETVLTPWNTGTPSANGTPGIAFTPLTDNQIQNAVLVPGSVRMWGPDSQAGPNCGLTTQYQFSPGTAGVDQFSVDYTKNSVNFSSYVGTNNAPLPISIAFNYQANLTLAHPTFPPSAPGVNPAPQVPNIASPMTLSASYESRDSISASIGIRVYRPSSALSDLSSYPATIAVGNANH